LVTNLFAGVPTQTSVYKFNPASATYVQLTYLGAAGWSPVVNRQMSCAPGEGVFVKKPASPATITVTFVGEVLQGELHNPVVVGFDIYSGMVPQEGGITAVHNYVPVNNDIVYKYTGTGYQSKTWLQALNRWQPAGEPVLGVGEAVFIKSTTVKDWVRTFTVN
jgi:hypothetical protein